MKKRNLIDGIVLVEPYSHRPGHYASFVKEFIKGFKEIGIKFKVITYSDVKNEDLKSIRADTLLPGFVSRLIKNLSIKKPSHVRFLETIITIIMCFSVYRKNKSYAYYFLDGDYLPITFFCFCSRSSKNYAYLHNTSMIPTSLHSNNIASIIKIKFLWKFLKKAISENRLAILSNPSVLKSKPRLAPLSRVYPVEWGLKELKTENPNIDPNINMKNMYFLLFGPNHEGKDYKTVFQAWELLKTKQKLYIAGKNISNKNDPTILGEKFINNKTLRIVDEYIPEENIAMIFKKAKAVLLSYSKDFTGTCSIFNFATQNKIPVIISDSCKESSIVKKKTLGLVFKASDPISLKKEINNFLSFDEKKIQEMKKNLQSYYNSAIKNKNWSTIIRFHYEIIIKDISTFSPKVSIDQ